MLPSILSHDEAKIYIKRNFRWQPNNGVTITEIRHPNEELSPSVCVQRAQIVHFVVHMPAGIFQKSFSL